LGLAEEEWPHRLLFVGDHPRFDAPRHPGVVFHLEPSALTRPAGELARLVLHLREAGGGSLRGGFDRLAARRWWPWRRAGRPLRREVPGLGPLLLVPRAEECPVIAFAEGPRAPAEAVVCELPEGDEQGR
jgi:hypothetical protein